METATTPVTGSTGFGTGLPPKGDNGANYGILKPLLADPGIKPAPADIRWTRDQFNDLLRLRGSSTLFRLRTAQDVQARLKFYNTGAAQNPVVLVGHLEGKGYAGAGFQDVLYFINVDVKPQSLVIDAEKGKPYVLHPVHSAAQAADARVVQQARYDAAGGAFTIPARTAAVFVVR
jgi:hypothetical protein